MPGPPPKPASKRRHYSKPKSYGAAEPIIAAAAAPGDRRELGFDDPHPLIASLWDTVAASCEAAFYSDSDWVRLRMELWNMDREMKADALPRPRGRPSSTGSTSCCCPLR